MAYFDVFDPLKNVELDFTEEQLEDFRQWFDEIAKPILTINNGEPINVITVEDLLDFLELKKVHRRSFHYPTYAEVMQEVELLKAGALRLLTKEQFIYVLNKWVLLPEIKHELVLAFQIFDTENRTFLDIDEIKTIVTTYADIFNEDETREILRDANVRGDGNVYYEEFVESIFCIAPELFKLKVTYLHDDPEEDPSVAPEVEPEPVPVPVVPPPPPTVAAKGKKGKKK